MRNLKKILLLLFCVIFSFVGETEIYARKRVYYILNQQDTSSKVNALNAEQIQLLDSLSIPQDTTDSLSLEVVLSPEDSLFLSLAELDEATKRDMDSLEAEYYLLLATDLPDERDIKKAVRRIKKERRDSIFKNTPRILDSYLIPDSLYYKRLLMWTHDPSTNKITLQKYDTTYNYHFNDLPITREDLNGIHLGVAGSPLLRFNYFKREKLKEAPFFEPYLAYSYTPETAIMYNVKTPYTELVYSGTTFAVRTQEEQNVRVLTTMNITPKTNIKLLYQKMGGAGMLTNEETTNKNWDIGVSHIGDKYEAHFGFLGQTVVRNENGGVKDISWVRDTIVDKKIVPINLTNAQNTLKRRTIFFTHSLTVPMNFFRKDRDSLSVGEGTTAYIGHSLEYSTYSKTYTDKLTTAQRSFYNGVNVMSSEQSRDSISVRKFDNKFFINLQPFASDALLSKISAGIGYQLLGFYSFDPEYYITGNKINWTHNTYVYGGVSGQFKKYFSWDANAQYNLSGYYAGDVKIGANMKFSFYPIEEGIHLNAHAETSTTTPHPFYQKLYFNHHQWNNDFKKSNEIKLEATLDIPHWDLSAFFGYSILGNHIYHDSLTIVRQAEKPTQVLTAALEKNFKLWFFHLDNRVMFQLSSNEDVLPLPMLSANLRYYLQFPLVKNVMTMQIGANALITSPYKIPGYCPDLGVFYNQSKETIGTNPYIDLFVNMQWKKASIFLKLENVAYGWPNKEYFSANRYILTDRAFKIGIFWPFY